jgi:hypothetical protein
MVDYLKLNRTKLNRISLHGEELKIGTERSKHGPVIKLTYMPGTNDVIFTLGYTIFPIAKIPPPFTVSKQCAKIFLTFPAYASCDSMDIFDWPNPRIPSRAWSEEPKPPPILAPHLQMKTKL